MSKVYNWVRANKLSFNIDKAKLIFPKWFSKTMGNILIDDHQTEANGTKFPGVIIDNHLYTAYK